MSETLGLVSGRQRACMEHTSHKSGTCRKGTVAQCVYGIPNQPMSRVGSHLVVENCERSEYDTNVERLHAVTQRKGEAHWNKCPTENQRIPQTDAARRKWAVTFVLLVLFQAQSLIADIELEDVHPKPECRMNNVKRLRLRSSDHAERCLNMSYISSVFLGVKKTHTIGIRTVFMSDSVNKYSVCIW